MSSSEVTHDTLLEKLIEHEDKFVSIAGDIKGIREDLDPIATGVKSIAFGFKALLWLGAGSAAVAGILELVDRLTP